MRTRLKVAVVVVPIAAIAFFVLAPVVYFPATIFNACNGCTNTFAGYESPSCELFHVGSGYYTKEIVTVQTFQGAETETFYYGSGSYTSELVTVQTQGAPEGTHGYESTAYYLSCPALNYWGLFK